MPLHDSRIILAPDKTLPFGRGIGRGDGNELILLSVPGLPAAG